MKGRRIFSMMAALVFTVLFAACDRNEKETPVQGEDAIVAILNNTGLDYWKQISTGIESECKAKGIVPLIWGTDDISAYDQQLKAIELVRHLDYNIVGVIAAPIWSENNHEVEQALADLNRDRQIPIVLADISVDAATSPLKDIYRSYVGTDNEEAGRELAQKIEADASDILVVRKAASTATVRRLEGMRAVKTGVKCFETSDADIYRLSQQLGDNTDVVFLNGSLYSEAIDMLGDRRVYVFDIYKEFFDILRHGNTLQGIMAQNTFEMGRQAVLDVIKIPETRQHYIPTIYVTKDNIDSEATAPFMNYFGTEKFIASVLGSKYDGYWQQFANSLYAASVKLGEVMTVKMAESSDDVNTGIARLEELKSYGDRMKGLIVVPGNRELEEAAAKTVQATGVRLICVDSPMTENSPLEQYCTTSILTDNALESVNLYNEAVDAHHTNILVVAQDESAASASRYGAMQKYLGDALKCVLVSPDDHEIAAKIQAAVEANPGITALVSLNGSSVTKETLEYCMAAGIEIYTFDDNDMIEKGIANGTVKVAYTQDLSSMATYAVQIISKSMTVDKVINVPVVRVTRSSGDQRIVE